MSYFVICIYVIPSAYKLLDSIYWVCILSNYLKFSFTQDIRWPPLPKVLFIFGENCIYTFFGEKFSENLGCDIFARKFGKKLRDTVRIGLIVMISWQQSDKKTLHCSALALALTLNLTLLPSIHCSTVHIFYSIHFIMNVYCYIKTFTFV